MIDQLVFPRLLGPLGAVQSLTKQLQSLRLQADPRPILSFLSCIDHFFKLFD